MKKLLGILVLSLLWCNVGYAQFIEFEKCLRTSGSFAVESWSESEWKKRNIFVKAPRDAFLKNYKNWGLDKIYAKDYSGIFAKEYPELNYIALEGPAYTYPEKFSSKLLSINAEFLTKLEKNIYSINTSSGIITNMQIKSEPYLEYINDYYKKMGSGFDFMRKKTITTKWKIDSYAGGIIQGFAIYPSGINKDSPITIDVNNKLISFQFGADSKTKTFICNDLASNSLDESSGSSGTAFFIDTKGYMLSNNHVVDGCKELKINYFDKEYDAKLIATDKTLDLALLKIDVRPKSYISFSDYNPKKLQKIYVAGYPFGKGLSDDLKISSGIVSSLKGVDDNSNELQIDAAINYGNSGGPIVGEGGELIGIAVSGLAKEVSEGINFGIKSTAALNFLGANDIDPSRAKRSSMNNDRLLKLLEESTLFISCTY
jgi:S1-C subfamily serine protease